MNFLNQNDEFDIYQNQYFNNCNSPLGNDMNNFNNNYNNFNGIQNSNMMYQLFNAMSNILSSQLNPSLMMNQVMPKMNMQQPINMEEFDEEEM